MPYKLEKSDGGYFVVDDKGKRYSNHPLTHWKARAQLRVLNEAEAKKSKEVSLDQQLGQIRNAIYDKFRPLSDVIQAGASNFYIRDVYESYALLDKEGKVYKVNYAQTPDGDVVVGEPVEVEISWVPTGKSLDALDDTEYSEVDEDELDWLLGALDDLAAGKEPVSPPEQKMSNRQRRAIFAALADQGKGSGAGGYRIVSQKPVQRLIGEIKFLRHAIKHGKYPGKYSEPLTGPQKGQVKKRYKKAVSQLHDHIASAESHGYVGGHGALVAAGLGKAYTMSDNGTVVSWDGNAWHPIQKAAPLKDGLPSSAFLVVEDPTKVTTWHLPVKDAQGKADHRLMGAAWAALHGGYRGQKYEGSNKSEAIGKLRALYEKEGMSVPGEKSFRVFKQADGQYRWVLMSSSAFKDRDGEIVTEKALADDVDRCDKSGQYGPLRWWHLGGYETPDGLEHWDTWKAGPGVDLGVCDFNMLHGKMLIESGTFKSPEIGEAFSDIQDLLEVSIAFSHPPTEPGETKCYQNIHRFERSLLPDGMASNLLTKLYVVKGESIMKAQEKLKALMAILKGKPELAQQILTDAESVQKAAEEAGLEFKEVEAMISTGQELEPEPEPEPVPEPEPLDVIGDMSHADLETFVKDQIAKANSVTATEYQAKEAQTTQALSDALASVKSLTDRLEAAEKDLKQTKQELLELTDARPAGIKQLQNQRPTEQTDNIVKTAPAGPGMDPGFLKFAQGGK